MRRTDIGADRAEGPSPSVTLAAQPASVATARRFVRRFAIDAGLADELVDDAAVVVTELVANAVLHAGGPIVVTVAALDAVAGGPSGVRIDVGDDSAVAPVLRSYGRGAATGRGLALVASLAARWGVEPSSVGKVVWVELAAGDRVGHEVPPSTPLVNLRVDGRRRGTRRPGDVDARFLRVPVATYLRLQEQNDAVLRELELLAFTADHPGGPEPSPELVDVIERSRRFFNVSSERFRRDVVAARDRDALTVDLVGTVSRANVDAARELVALFEQAEAIAATGELLVSPPEPEVARLLRWFVDELVAQLLDNRAPEPFDP